MHVAETTTLQQERVLFIINDNTIFGSTRLQKYGFLLSKQYAHELMTIKQYYTDLDFYDDWKPYNYGPYSKTLATDIEKCVGGNIIRRSLTHTQGGRVTHTYSLTTRGRHRWRELFGKIEEMKKLDEKVKQLQKVQYYTLLRQIYNAYPEYTTKSKIKDSLDA